MATIDRVKLNLKVDMSELTAALAEIEASISRIVQLLEALPAPKFDVGQLPVDALVSEVSRRASSKLT